MTDWFRSWHGAPTDPKWIVVAKKAGVPFHVVSAVVWALFDYASQQDDRGDIRDFDAETYAALAELDEDKVWAVISALRDKGVIADYRLTAWEKRQPQKEDGAAERAKAWRERKRTQANDEERPEKIQSREEKKEHTAQAPADDGFEDVWRAYPKREGPNPKKPAHQAYSRALKRGGTPDAILAAAKALALKHPAPTPYVPQAVTWLNQDRWSEADSTGPPENVVQFRSVEDILAEKAGADEARAGTVSGT